MRGCAEHLIGLINSIIQEHESKILSFDTKIAFYKQILHQNDNFAIRKYDFYGRQRIALQRSLHI